MATPCIARGDSGFDAGGFGPSGGEEEGAEGSRENHEASSAPRKCTPLFMWVLVCCIHIYAYVNVNIRSYMCSKYALQQRAKPIP